MATIATRVVGFIRLRELYSVTHSEEACVIWARANGLLADQMQCPHCNAAMSEKPYSRAAEGVVWRCHVVRCRATVSIRKGSFFERSRLSLQKLIDMIYYWAMDLPLADSQYQVATEHKTVIDWYNFMRDVCTADLQANPVHLGGAGRIVALGEIVIARGKARNVNRQPEPRQWIFGGVDLTTGEFFMQLIQRRDAATLTPIIQRYVILGSTIWTNEWVGYNDLNNIGYVHQTVNHRQYFVDPTSGVHINSIRARLGACKASFKRRNGAARHMLEPYLDEYMWRARHPRPHTFADILAAIRRQYHL